MRPSVKHILSTAFAVALLLVPAASIAAETAESAKTAGRTPPRIIYGESQGTTFEFGELRVPRRTNAGNRQAYFGSGEDYSSALAGLQDRLQSMTARSRLESLPLSPAQEAAKSGMAPALMRALTRAKQARQDADAAD